VSPKTRTGPYLPWAALALMGLFAGPDRATPEDPTQPVRRYTVRAEIVQMPKRPGGYLTIRHEAVDDFVDVTGDLVGMNAMVMGFPVAKDASVDGLKVGDKIEATLVVDWTRGFGELARIKKLPAETMLHFRKARPAKNAPPPPDGASQEK